MAADIAALPEVVALLAVAATVALEEGAIAFTATPVDAFAGFATARWEADVELGWKTVGSCVEFVDTMGLCVELVETIGACVEFVNTIGSCVELVDTMGS
jgi:hypothetical protein